MKFSFSKFMDGLGGYISLIAMGAFITYMVIVSMGF